MYLIMCSHIYHLIDGHLYVFIYLSTYSSVKAVISSVFFNECFDLSVTVYLTTSKDWML